MRLLKLLVCLALCSCFAVEAFAHPGRTDSNGGHTNHSTGEYHYHHGYSAHQHYDFDGDGDVDCPYNFDDKTGSSGGSAKITKDPSQSSTSTKRIKDEALAAIEPKPSDKVAPAVKTKSFLDHAFDFVCIALEIYVVIGCGWGIIRFIKWIFGW